MRDSGVVAHSPASPAAQPDTTLIASHTLGDVDGLLARLASSRWVAPLAIALATTLLFHAVVAWSNPGYWSGVIWDELYYADIARFGYALVNNDYTQWSRLPFSPGWPLLLRGASDLTGLEPAVVRTPLAAILFVVGCLGLASAFAAFSSNLRRNNAALLLFALWPPSLYFRSGYAEALYFPLLAWFFAYLLRGRLVLAACLTSAALFVRTPAVVLVGTLVAGIVLDQLRSRRLVAGLGGIAVRLALLLPLSLLGLVAYAGIMWSQFGHPFAFTDAYVAWGWYDSLDWRGYLLETVVDATRLSEYDNSFTIKHAVITFLLTPLIVWPMRSAMPAILTVFTFGAWVFFQSRNWDFAPYQDILRWMAVVFPVQYCLVLWIERLPRWRGLAYGVLALGLAVLFVIYVDRYCRGVKFVS